MFKGWMKMTGTSFSRVVDLKKRNVFFTPDNRVLKSFTYNIIPRGLVQEVVKKQGVSLLRVLVLEAHDEAVLTPDPKTHHWGQAS